MATRKQVSCINKKGDHYNPHERIESIGGVYAGSRWKTTESSAIFNIKYGLEEYYVIVGGQSVNVIIAKHGDQEYLKTTADGYAPNNLLNLNECPLY
jgi:hypothetical protein